MTDAEGTDDAPRALVGAFYISLTKHFQNNYLILVFRKQARGIMVAQQKTRRNTA